MAKNAYAKRLDAARAAREYAIRTTKSACIQNSALTVSYNNTAATVSSRMKSDILRRTENG